MTETSPDKPLIREAEPPLLCLVKNKEPLAQAMRTLAHTLFIVIVPGGEKGPFRNMSCTRPAHILIEPVDDEKKRVHYFPFDGARYDLAKRRSLLQQGFIEVPCGRCLSCRLDYSRIWANRCYLESLTHPYCWFITLTYDGEHLVFGSQGYATLEKDAISNFIRTLRDKVGHDTLIRYFGCGEYGEAKGERQGFNPHYHIILFTSYRPSDLSIDHPDRSKPILKSGKYPIFRRKNRKGDYVLYSQEIFDCWQKGKIEIEEAGWNCAAYVSRYVIKKQYGRNADVYERLGIVPEFLRMSNRPGIGAEWLLSNQSKLLDNDYLSVKTANGVKTTRPPRYFEKLMMRDPESLQSYLMQSSKLNRLIKSRISSIETSTTKFVGNQLKDEEEEIEKKTKQFTRSFT